MTAGSVLFPARPDRSFVFIKTATKQHNAINHLASSLTPLAHSCQDSGPFLSYKWRISQSGGQNREAKILINFYIYQFTAFTNRLMTNWSVSNFFSENIIFKMWVRVNIRCVCVCVCACEVRVQQHDRPNAPSTFFHLKSACFSLCTDKRS